MTMIFYGMAEQKYFLLDTNLIRRFARKGHERELEQFWSDLDAHGISKGGSGFWPIVSSFVLLEVTGIKLSGEPPAPSAEQISQFKTPADHAVWVYENALTFYQGRGELALNNIKAELEKTRSYLSTDGLGLLNAVIADNLDRPDFEEDVRTSLALDRMLQFPYPESVVKELHMGGFWPMVKKSLDDGGDLSFMRLGVRMWERLPSKKRRDLFKVDNQKDLAKIFSVKSIGDLVDTELVHFAIVGKVIGGKRVPIEAFTFDDPKVIRNRIGIYKGVLRLIKEKFEESKMDTSAFTSFCGGKVHFFSNNGKFLETIKVDEVVVE